MNRRTKWISIAFLAALMAAPNATIIRINLFSVDPYFYNICRYGVVIVVCLFLFMNKKYRTGLKGMKAAVISAIAITIAVISYTLALEQSQASYVAIFVLLTPVIFVAISHRVMKETINTKALQGILLAVIGALLLVTGPLFVTGSTTLKFYPFATVLALVNCIAFAVALVWMRRANEAGASMVSVISI